MILIWKGYGWLAPVIFLGCGMVLQGLKVLLGREGHLSSQESSLFATVAGMVIIVVGVLLNRPLDWTFRRKSMHTFWFLPLELWGLISISLGLYGLWTSYR